MKPGAFFLILALASATLSVVLYTQLQERVPDDCPHQCGMYRSYSDAFTKLPFCTRTCEVREEKADLVTVVNPLFTLFLYAAILFLIFSIVSFVKE